MKKVITVVVDTENEARFERPEPDRAQSRIYSLRVAEVANPGTAQERQQPVGHDGGFLWRLYTYWRFLERDGGVYVQCEAISLTRGIPFALGWLIGPFVNSIPRESLAFYPRDDAQDTRNAPEDRSLIRLGSWEFGSWVLTPSGSLLGSFARILQGRLGGGRFEHEHGQCDSDPECYRHHRSKRR